MYNHDERTWRVVACACCKPIQGVEELLSDKDIQAPVAQKMMEAAERFLYRCKYHKASANEHARQQRTRVGRRCLLMPGCWCNQTGDAGGCHRAMVPCAKRACANDAIAGYELVSLPATQNNISHLVSSFPLDGTDRLGSRTRSLSLNCASLVDCAACAPPM